MGHPVGKEINGTFCQDHLKYEGVDDEMPTAEEVTKVEDVPTEALHSDGFFSQLLDEAYQGLDENQVGKTRQIN